MKNKTRNLYPTILSIALASFANVASADVTKDNNSDALNIGTSYIAPFLLVDEASIALVRDHLEGSSPIVFYELSGTAKANGLKIAIAATH